MAEMIDGKKIAAQIKQEIIKEINDKKLEPNLAVVLVGDDPASKIYVNLKKKACHEVGIEFHEYLLPINITQDQVLETIDFLNRDEKIDAILVQLPLPKHLDTDIIIQAINPQKDVDGFHPENIKNFIIQKSNFVPGLPLGIIKLIESTKEDLKDKQALILAKNKILYQPLAKLLDDLRVQTTIMLPSHPALKNQCQQADILITAVGKPFFVTADMIKEGAIIIDIGTNKIDNNYVVGDVDYTAVFSKAGHITPVPGGVGPVTVAMLLYNTVKLAQK
jgi:methylenetetrahydrofolate dehydrogenase (NADP+)/methenyltetrahydrofolate cyclohydrolase